MMIVNVVYTNSNLKKNARKITQQMIRRLRICGHWFYNS